MSKQVVKTLIIVYKIYLQYVANNLLINFVLWAFRADGSKHNLFAKEWAQAEARATAKPLAKYFDLFTIKKKFLNFVNNLFKLIQQY